MDLHPWKCLTCTFDNIPKDSRCIQCLSHRCIQIPIPKQKQSKLSFGKDNSIIDLTNDTTASCTGGPVVASTESARKRRRKRQTLSGLVEECKSSSSTATQKSHRDDIDIVQVRSVSSASNDTKRKTSSCKEGREERKKDLSYNRNVIDLEHGNARYQRGRKQYKDSDKNVHSFGRDAGLGDIANINDQSSSSNISMRSTEMTISSNLSFSKHNSNNNSTKLPSKRQQRTLFGKVINDIRQTKEDKNSNTTKRERSNFNSNKNSSTKLSSNNNPIMSSSTSTSSSSSSFHATRKRDSSHFQKLSYDELHQKAMINLQTIFKIKSLRNLQPQAIQTVLKNESQIIVMATGGGKSLCYQLPATVLDGVTIVVSPLIALMLDQVYNLKQRGIEAVNISSMNGVKENNLIMKRLLGEHAETKKGQKSTQKNDKIDKHRPIKLVYCTPELIQTVRFRAVLANLYERNQLSLIAIDEAHCLSVWGHDFRPAFRKLSYLRSSFPDIPLMACTATATEKVIEDIREVLCLNNGEVCHISSFNRTNIHYEIRYKDAMGDMNALQDLVNVVQEEHSTALKNYEPCSGIVYVHKRDDTNLIAAEITKAGIPATTYHAGLKDKERKEIQKQWTDGVYKVAVATVAFGMGIDLAHVRYVLHWSLSKSVESFYQESGRAGRDQKPSKSIVYYSKDDASKFQFLIRKNAENKRAKDAKNGIMNDTTDERSMDALMKMIDLCTQPCCRRQYLLLHFGEVIDPTTVCQKTCDFCIDPNRMERAMEKGRAEGAKRYVMQQQKNFQSARKWTNRSENADESSDEWANDTGLGITQYNDTSYKPSSMKGFQSAKSVLSHFEAMECAGQKNGFVTFKRSKNLDINDKEHDDEGNKKASTIKIPSHIRDKLGKLTTTRTDSKPEKRSHEYRSEAEKLRAEIEEMKRKAKTLRSNMER